MASLIKIRRDTASNWQSVDPTLSSGEQGLETDTGKIKYGTGFTPWNSLPYAHQSASTAVSASYAFNAELLDGSNSTAFATTGSNTFSGKQIIASGSEFTYTLEKSTVSATAATGTIHCDALTQSVLYYTANAINNWTFNVRGNATTTLNSIMAIGQTITLVFLVTNGSSAYYPTAHTIDGNSVTPKWQGGTAATSGNTNSIDVYSYSIIKTADATFTVLVSQTKFA